MTFQAQKPQIMTLDQILTFKRPAKSKIEQVFVNMLVARLKPYGATVDDFGNVHVRIGDAPTVLWSSHTDTVHKTEGTQAVTCIDGFYESDSGECLGADDSTGIWIMLEMIRANMPGLYIFHREEETGGNGSSYIAHKTPEVLAGIQAAIAFDRKGYTSVITHQGGRCCSDAFGLSLATGLGLGFKLDDTGLFTDTANYVDIIPECTNLSVGYFGQHTAKETQDVDFPQTLLNAVLCLDLGSLVIKRDPKERDLDDYHGYGRGFGRQAYKSSAWAWEDYDWRKPAKEDTLQDIVFDNPEMVAAFLVAYGFTAKDINDFIENEEAYIGGH